MDYAGDTASLERPSDLGSSPQSVVKRWLLELKLADKREKDWRKSVEKIWDRYRQKSSKKNSFNILWSNTETLRPAVYNSLPQPDVRRRYKDADPMGKAVSEVLKRSLSYGLDTQDFDGTMKHAVLDMLLPGRAVVRVRYVPDIVQVGDDDETESPTEDQAEGSEEVATGVDQEAMEGDAEEVAWEQATVEHVQWDDYRQGSGKCWEEVQWIGFRHKLTRDELEEKFGDDIGGKIDLDATDDEDVQKERDQKVAGAFLTAEVWEIWDKEEKKVYFISSGYKEAPCKVLDDPLQLSGFYPIPRPLYAIEDSSSTIPVPLYALYQEQADELDKINLRINKIVDGLKLRGIYDATLSELSEVMRGQDNDLIPAQNVTALLERGGLEKAIWMWPIETAANVLKVLFEQRESAKQVIYEVTGIADIIRGASNATETATAQQIKDKWGSMRLKRMQSDVARFIRDLMRLQAEIIGEKFELKTLQTMTGLNYPTMEQKQQAMMQYQQQVMMMQQQPQQPGQPPQQPPPPPDLPPAWEEIQQCLKDDAQRTFKVDVETDSTVAASIESDMQGLQQVTQAIGVVMKELIPLVQQQVMPLEAAKELLMTIARRARFGNAMEDAIDAMKQPPPPPPEAQQQDNSAQTEQIKQQGAQQLEAAKQQHEQSLEGARLQVEQAKEQAITERESTKAQFSAQLEQMKMQNAAQVTSMQIDFDRWKAQLDAETKIAVAQISAQTSLQTASLSAESAAAGQNDGGMGDFVSGVTDSLAQLLQLHEEMKQERSQPIEVKRGPDGKIAAIGKRQVARGPDGKVMGLQ